MFSYGAISTNPISAIGVISVPITVFLTGVLAVGSAGTVTAVEGVEVIVEVTGLEATGYTYDSEVFVFSIHTPNQEPDYDCEKPDQEPVWTDGSI